MFLSFNSFFPEKLGCFFCFQGFPQKNLFLALSFFWWLIFVNSLVIKYTALLFCNRNVVNFFVVYVIAAMETSQALNLLITHLNCFRV